MMLAWIKRNKYLLGFLIAVIAIVILAMVIIKAVPKLKKRCGRRPLNMDIYRTAYQLPAV